MCAVPDFQFEVPQTVGNNLWVYSNLCDEMIVGDVSKTLLRRVPITNNVGDIQNYIFISHNYLHIVRKNITSIHVYIYGDNNSFYMYTSF